MQMDRIKQFKLADPFRPFHLLLKDGRRFLIEQSYEIAVAPDGSRVGVSGRHGVVLLWPKDVKDVEVIQHAMKS